MSKEDQQRYHAACHAMQSGVAMELQTEAFKDSASPKHLRVGVNSAMVETSTIVRLLIEKGIITMDEWDKELADSMEEEVERYQQRLASLFGKRVILK